MVSEENNCKKSNKELQGDAKWCNIQSTGALPVTKEPVE